MKFITILTVLLTICCLSCTSDKQTEIVNSESDVPTQLEMAQAYYNAAKNSLIENEKFSAPNVISSLSRMTGSYLFRTFSIAENEAKPGDIMLSKEANVKGKELVLTLGTSLQETFAMGLTTNQTDLDLRPEVDLEFLQSQEILEPAFQPLNQHYNLSGEKLINVLTLAVGVGINEYKNQIDPIATFGLAVAGFVEGTKTMPGKIE